MPHRARPFDPFAPLASNTVRMTEDGPSSEVRPIDAVLRARSLVVVTSLRDAAAQSSWVTITDAAGVVYFEGAPNADGTVTLSFEGAPHVDCVQVLLETGRAHRQAQVRLQGDRTEHRFD
jgi:hypothetical protein